MKGASEATGSSLGGAKKWKYDGVIAVSKVWSGCANFPEVEAEQAYSINGGRTRAPDWIEHLTREE